MNLWQKTTTLRHLELDSRSQNSAWDAESSSAWRISTSFGYWMIRYWTSIIPVVVRHDKQSTQQTANHKLEKKFSQRRFKKIYGLFVRHGITNSLPNKQIAANLKKVLAMTKVSKFLYQNTKSKAILKAKPFPKAQRV